MFSTIPLILVSSVLLVQQANEVEIVDLAGKPELVGKDLLVDARIALFLMHPGRGFDEILLKDSDVIMRLPPALRFRESPTQRVVRAQGRLVREGSKLFFDVRSLQLLPEDAERLETALNTLPVADLNARRAWARWAARRAAIYRDEKLGQRALQVETDLLWAEAARPESSTPNVLLALAKRGREQALMEPIPTALAHRAFQLRLAGNPAPDELAALARDLENFLPEAKQPLKDQPAELGEWLARYRQQPDTTYRDAPPHIRTALDRWLLAEVRQLELLSRLALDPMAGMDLAGQAATLLPDRPDLARQLRQRGLDAAAEDVSRLRRNEAIELARTLQDAGQEDKAQSVLRAWLANYRKTKLTQGDASGRVELAQDYLNLLKDRGTAVSLLREAHKLDPKDAAGRDLFRRLGFRLEQGEWVEADAQAANRAVSNTQGVQVDAQEDALLGLMPEEVERRMGGKPNMKSQIVTQGNILIQWVYSTRAGQGQYITFQQRPGAPPTVISRHTLP